MPHDTLDLARRLFGAAERALHPTLHDVYRLLETIHANQLIILQREKQIMSGQDDLKAALVQLGTDIDNEIAALIAAQSNGDDAAFEDAANNIKSLSQKLQTSLAPKAQS